LSHFEVGYNSGVPTVDTSLPGSRVARKLKAIDVIDAV
jgi:hypothetical protein